uniref:Uncharacterized protein n=1 Tax=Cacopsylla melanoneura TaxID=428564 RepID=A0A8D8TCD2_9HEMI
MFSRTLNCVSFGIVIQRVSFAINYDGSIASIKRCGIVGLGYNTTDAIIHSKQDYYYENNNCVKKYSGSFATTFLFGTRRQTIQCLTNFQQFKLVHCERVCVCFTPDFKRCYHS